MQEDTILRHIKTSPKDLSDCCKEISLEIKDYADMEIKFSLFEIEID